MADNPIWKRLPSDTDKSFEAFVLYRDMGANRSLRIVAEKLSKSDTLINRWSRDNDWVNRVAAFDNSLDEKNLNENAERQKLIKDNAFSDYLKLRRAIDKRMGLLEAVDFRGELYEIVNLAELMKKADDYARRAVGLPDKITEQKTAISNEDNKPFETRNTNVNLNAENAHDAGSILRQLIELGAIPPARSSADNDPTPE